jgi:hypothetical protein
MRRMILGGGGEEWRPAAAAGCGMGASLLWCWMAKTSRRPWGTGKCTILYINSKGRKAKGPTPTEPRPEAAGRGGGGNPLELNGKYTKEAVEDGKMYINSKGRKAKSPHPQNRG